MITSGLFALIAAVLFSFAMQSQKAALVHLDDLTGTFVSVATMALTFWLVSFPYLKWEFWSSSAVLYFVIAGLFFPALGQRFQISAVKQVGPALTAAFGSFLPFFAAFPAILFLGETLSLQQVIGMTILIAGLLLAAIARGVNWRQRAFYVLLVPLGAALARAISQPFAKAGYNLLAEPLFATVVMTTVSTVVVGMMVSVLGSPRLVYPFGRGHLLFALNGLLIGFGIIAMQLSLNTSTVSLTASLVSTTPIWTLVLGIFVFKNERLHAWHGIVAALVCAGALLIVTGQTGS